MLGTARLCRLFSPGLFSQTDFLRKLIVQASSRSRRLIAALLVLLVLALLAWWWLGAEQQVQAPQSSASDNARTPVVIAETQVARDNVTLEVVGSGIAAASVTVFPAVSGEVERVLFTAGQQVKKDQLLVKLVDRDEQLAVKLAQTRLDGARQLLNRYQRAQGSGAVSENVLDEARIAFRQAEIELAQAREQLRYRSIRAPFAGVVGIAQVDPGDRVGTDTALVTLDDRNSLSVAFQIPEPFLARLQRGQKLALTTVAFAEREFAGQLAHIDSRIDAQTRTVTVRATVPNDEDLLRPGMSFRIRLPLTGEDLLRVPELAVQWAREGAHVWIIRDEKSVRVPVQVVRRMEGSVLVKGDMQAGEAVVIEGVQRLRPGRLVRLIQTDAPAARSAATEES